MTKNELFDRIIDDGIATESEINLVTDIAGDSIETLNKIVYARTGFVSIEQYEAYKLDEQSAEPDDIDDDTGFDPYMGEYTFDC